MLSANGGGRARSNSGCFETTHASNKTHQAIAMFEMTENRAHHLACKWGGLRPPKPPVVSNPSMLPIKKKHHFITMFAGKESCANHFVCKWWGCAPPNPPCCFETIHFCKKKGSIMSSPLFSMTESSADHFLCKQRGLLCAPTPPLFLGQPCMQKP